MAFMALSPFIAFVLWYILWRTCKKNKIRKYLKGKRSEIIRRGFPECVYEPTVHHFSKHYFKKHSHGNWFEMFLGSASFKGMCSDVHMDEAILSYSNSDAGDNDEYPRYYQTIILSCRLPQGSILNMPGEVTFVEPGSMNFCGRRKKYKLSDSYYYAVLERTDYDDRWIYCFEHGLAEKLIDLFKPFRADFLTFSGDMLTFGISICYTHLKFEFTEKHDYVVRFLDELRDTVMKIHMIANWVPDRP